MSSILKALKKLEEEQAGRLASPTGAVGHYVAPARANRRPLLLLASGISIGLLLAAGLYVLIDNRADTPAVVSSAPQDQKPAAVAGAAMPQIPAVVAVKTETKTSVAVPAVSHPESTEPIGKAVIAAEQMNHRSASPAVKSVKAVVVTAVEPAPIADKGSADTQSGTVEQVQVERLEIPAAGHQWSAPHLMVSDILPVSGTGHMAIVNGLPVMEGTMVEDALVREIYPDRVIFVIDGKNVVVPLTSSR